MTPALIVGGDISTSVLIAWRKTYFGTSFKGFEEYFIPLTEYSLIFSLEV